METIYKYSRRIDFKYYLLFGAFAVVFMLFYQRPVTMVPLGIFCIWTGINYAAEYKPFFATMFVLTGIFQFLAFLVMRSL